jgi:ABC-type sugar transport system ATPase subunit
VVQSARVRDLIRRVRDSGIGVVLISHNMPEVMELADRIEVLRLGVRVARFRAADTTMEQVIAAMTGALGSEESGLEESFSAELEGGLEYPHYTRPAEFRGWEVPEVLLSGDHARIAEWRREQSRARTLS